MTNKEQILHYKIIDSYKQIKTDWNDPLFAIHATFKIDEVEQMSEQEINNLIRLAKTLQEALYWQ